MRLALLLLCGTLAGQTVRTIDPVAEFTAEALGKLKAGVLPPVCVDGRMLIVWPHADPVRVYVAFAPIGPELSGPHGVWIGAPFMPDPRLDALPRQTFPFGVWRGIWPTLAVDVPATPGPLLFQTVNLPIPPGPHAVQCLVVSPESAAALREAVAIR